MVTAVVLGVGAQAHAQAAPHNVGWLYTASGSGAVFFDADVAGYPSQEKITVCDNRSDNRGIKAVVAGMDTSGIEIVKDPSNDGGCASLQGNLFPDGYRVEVEVCEYWNSSQPGGPDYDNYNYGYGVA
jgi:hypothetical protein